MSAKKNGAAPPKPVRPRMPSGMTFRPNDALNEQLRLYLLRNGITFNELCEAAVQDFLRAHPKWPRPSLHLPRGRRPRVA
jgi:hypothetical protein